MATREGEETPKRDQVEREDINEATGYTEPVITKEEENPGKGGDNKTNPSKTINLTTKMQEESAVQYVAKLKAKLVADRKTRMAATKLTVTKVVVKQQRVNHVQPP